MDEYSQNNDQYNALETGNMMQNEGKHESGLQENKRQEGNVSIAAPPLSVHENFAASDEFIDQQHYRQNVDPTRLASPSKANQSSPFLEIQKDNSTSSSDVEDLTEFKLTNEQLMRELSACTSDDDDELGHQNETFGDGAFVTAIEDVLNSLHDSNDEHHNTHRHDELGKTGDRDMLDMASDVRIPQQDELDIRLSSDDSDGIRTLHSDPLLDSITASIANEDGSLSNSIEHTDDDDMIHRFASVHDDKSRPEIEAAMLAQAFEFLSPIRKDEAATPVHGNHNNGKARTRRNAFKSPLTSRQLNSEQRRSLKRKYYNNSVVNNDDDDENHNRTINYSLDFLSPISPTPKRKSIRRHSPPITEARHIDYSEELGDTVASQAAENDQDLDTALLEANRLLQEFEHTSSRRNSLTDAHDKVTTTTGDNINVEDSQLEYLFADNDQAGKNIDTEHPDEDRAIQHTSEAYSEGEVAVENADLGVPKSDDAGDSKDESDIDPSSYFQSFLEPSNASVDDVDASNFTIEEDDAKSRDSDVPDSPDFKSLLPEAVSADNGQNVEDEKDCIQNTGASEQTTVADNTEGQCAGDKANTSVTVGELSNGDINTADLNYTVDTDADDLAEPTQTRDNARKVGAGDSIDADTALDQEVSCLVGEDLDLTTSNESKVVKVAVENDDYLETVQYRYSTDGTHTLLSVSIDNTGNSAADEVRRETTGCDTEIIGKVNGQPQVKSSSENTVFLPQISPKLSDDSDNTNSVLQPLQGDVIKMKYVVPKALQDELNQQGDTASVSSVSTYFSPSSSAVKGPTGFDVIIPISSERSDTDSYRPPLYPKHARGMSSYQRSLPSQSDHRNLDWENLTTSGNNDLLGKESNGYWMKKDDMPASDCIGSIFDHCVDSENKSTSSSLSPPGSPLQDAEIYDLSLADSEESDSDYAKHFVRSRVAIWNMCYSNYKIDGLQTLPLEEPSLHCSVSMPQIVDSGLIPSESASFVTQSEALPEESKVVSIAASYQSSGALIHRKKTRRNVRRIRGCQRNTGSKKNESRPILSLSTNYKAICTSTLFSVDLSNDNDHSDCKSETAGCGVACLSAIQYDEPTKHKRYNSLPNELYEVQRCDPNPTTGEGHDHTSNAINVSTKMSATGLDSPRLREEQSEFAVNQDGTVLQHLGRLFASEVTFHSNLKAMSTNEHISGEKLTSWDDFLETFAQLNEFKLDHVGGYYLSLQSTLNFDDMSISASTNATVVGLAKRPRKKLEFGEAKPVASRAKHHVSFDAVAYSISHDKYRLSQFWTIFIETKTTLSKPPCNEKGVIRDESVDLPPLVKDLVDSLYSRLDANRTRHQICSITSDNDTHKYCTSISCGSETELCHLLMTLAQTTKRTETKDDTQDNNVIIKANTASLDSTTGYSPQQLSFDVEVELVDESRVEFSLVLPGSLSTVSYETSYYDKDWMSRLLIKRSFDCQTPASTTDITDVSISVSDNDSRQDYSDSLLRLLDAGTNYLASNVLPLQPALCYLSLLESYVITANKLVEESMLKQLKASISLVCLDLASRTRCDGIVSWNTPEDFMDPIQLLHVFYEITQGIAYDIALTGNWYQVLSVFQSCLVLYERELPHHHPLVIVTLLDSAFTSGRCGNIEFARRLLHRADQAFSTFLTMAEDAYTGYIDQCIVDDFSEATVFRRDDGFYSTRYLHDYIYLLQSVLQRKFANVIDDCDHIMALHNCFLGDATALLANMKSIQRTTFKSSSNDPLLIEARLWQTAYQHYTRAYEAYSRDMAVSDPVLISVSCSIAKCLRSLGKGSHALKMLSVVVEATEDIYDYHSDDEQELEHDIVHDNNTDSFVPERLSCSRVDLDMAEYLTARAECLWLMAVLVIDEDPNEVNRVEALHILHAASRTLQHGIKRILTNDEAGRRKCLTVLRCIEAEAKSIFEPGDRISSKRDWRRFD